ncbi:hypothetical protein LOD99_10291 [Oopsacas minuta]|uniref:Uncharacterized protein n=1 Tax=Oopsacas minuta TaxID=111878 RepID=A0AAV7KIH0_9METZ|nr:hypothetical protein LOD99_10291 [Oopsacas minuta]
MWKLLGLFSKFSWPSFIWFKIFYDHSFLSNLHTSSSGDITVAVERLVREYSEDLEEDLSVELIQFVSFVKSEQDQQALASNEPEVKFATSCGYSFYSQN